MKLRHNNVWLGLQLLCVAAAAMPLAGCNSSVASGGGGMPAPEVMVSEVQERDVHSWDEFNGRVSAIDSVAVRPRVSGYIERMAFKEGDEVKKGDLLFLVDQRPYQAELHNVSARLEHARTAAELASAQVDRAQTLIGVNAISREEFDNRKAALAQANSDVHSAEAALAKAKLDLSFTEVRAPVAGRVSSALLTVGNLAQADQSVLTTLVSQNAMYVYFDCDEKSYQRYQSRLQNSGKRSGSDFVRVNVANEVDFPRTGKVDFLDNRIDPNTGTIRIRAVLPNADKTLTPGMYARVKLDGSGQFKAMVIDDKAVLTDQDKKFIYVVSKDNKAMRKDLVLGPLVDESGQGHAMRVVRSGLDPNDQVIVSGTLKIFYPGMPVKPVRATLNTAANPASVAK
ncbi:efflux RND transporter periplasmic adaptor subunit [Duganella guangzhouensis]|nr:efflux RND transporter periplasmic adaptor subunit [Duganella guangzhouensis]